MHIATTDCQYIDRKEVPDEVVDAISPDELEGF